MESLLDTWKTNKGGKNMKVLYCTSEALPFAATGGLAEAAGSLPQALRTRLIGCRVVLPLYDEIEQELKDNMQFCTSLSVPVAWRRQYCGVFEAKYNGVIYYLIDNPYYFKRKGLYGHYDDAERFAFFSRAALEMLPFLDFQPDVIHCNDWQTALTPVYLKLFYANQAFYKDIRTVLTIHNIQYQGRYGMELLEDVLGVPAENQSLMEYDGAINLLKGAIQTVDWITTVSPSYAQEILNPWYSHELDSVLREHTKKLSGILNGIDAQQYNPETDCVLKCPYSVENLSGKAQAKRELQVSFKLEERPRAPLVGMVTRMLAQKGLKLVKETLDQFLWESDAQFIALGSGEAEYENFFREMQQKYPGRLCACLDFDPELARRIYAGSDIFLLPSKTEPCGTSQMIALRYGAVPVVRETGGFKDSVKDNCDGTGNGFTFQAYSGGDLLDALRRAVQAYQNPEEWQALVKRAMQCDHSWGHSANEYIRLYRSLVKENTQKRQKV